MKNFAKKIMAYGVITGLLFEAFPVWALSKDESIYAKLDSEGQVSQVIVSEHLEGTENGKTNDKTKLENIQNVNGDEKYTLNDGKLIWESNGNDIYYQGTTKEELPITLNIKYYLNGEESTIPKMLGKKGTVKIVLKYANNDKHIVNVNGKSETLYTPFVVATTTIIPNTTNKNIKVTNGKVVTNGTSSVVVTLSTPGLYESLNIDKLQGMDTAEITYDTDSFELSSIYSVATPKLVEKSDLDSLNNIDKIYDSINTLVSSSNKIKNGSGQLVDGANKLKDGVNKLVDGINKAYNGSSTITNGVQSSINNLQNDNSPALDNDTLAYIKSQAVNGAKQTINSTFTDQYKTNIANQAWSSVKENMNPNDENVISIVTDAVTSNVTDAVTNAVNEAVVSYLTETGQLSDYSTCEASGRQDPSCLNVDYKALSYIKDAATKAATNAAKGAASTTASKVSSYVAENVSKQVSVNIAQQTATTVAEQTAGNVSTSVATQVAENAKKTATEKTVNSLETLLQGLKELTGGLNEINSKMGVLKNGTQDLQNGISALDSGISQFNSQGINKISNLVNGDVKSLEGKIKALGKLSEDYGTFDDKDGNTEGATKIIMVVDAVKANTKTVIKNDKISEEKESLWDKIKGLFK